MEFCVCPVLAMWIEILCSLAVMAATFMDT